MVSPKNPEQLVIALEPEAASLYCRKLKMYQLAPEVDEEKPLRGPELTSEVPMNMNPACETLKEGLICTFLQLCYKILSFIFLLFP